MRSSKTAQTRLRSNRGLFEMAAAAGLTIAGLLVLGDPPLPVLAQGAGVPVNELMADEALPDIALGASNAPVTIIEYASMTCVHCAAFYATTFPELKSKYIDTARSVLSCGNFPLTLWRPPVSWWRAAPGMTSEMPSSISCSPNRKNWAFTEKRSKPWRVSSSKPG